MSFVMAECSFLEKMKISRVVSVWLHVFGVSRRGGEIAYFCYSVMKIQIYQRRRVQFAVNDSFRRKKEKSPVCPILLLESMAVW